MLPEEASRISEQMKTLSLADVKWKKECRAVVPLRPSWEKTQFHAYYLRL